ncbi:MAG: heparinase, partial [Bacteroidales bacterium]|nr:heparinase [Bacteroidales bacterium]
ESAVRTASVDRKGFLHIEDRVHASSGPVSLQWIMVTPADVEILGQNKARLSKDGVMMLLEVRSSVPVSMNVMSNEPPHDYDAPNPGSCRVGFSADIAASSEAKFKVTLRRISK